MKRRHLLAAAATGLAGGLAGCGYAYGGGDITDSAVIDSPTSGFDTWVEFALTDHRIVRIESLENPFEEWTWETEIRIADRDGTVVWTGTYSAASEAVAYAPGMDTVYLLAGHPGGESETPTGIAAVQVDESNDERADDTIAWEHVTVEEIADPIGLRGASPVGGGSGVLTANAAGAYCLVEDEVVAVRDGAQAWRRKLEGVTTVAAGDGVVAVAAPDGAWAFDTAGDETWHLQSDGVPTVAPIDHRTLVHADEELRLLDADGEEEWTTGLTPPGAEFRMGDGLAIAEWGSRVSVIDLSDGTVLWERSNGISPPVAWDGRRAYSTGSGCRISAVDDEGERWRRELDLGTCSAVDAWIDGETVAVLFESGELRWLQRDDEEPGLFW